MTAEYKPEYAQQVEQLILLGAGTDILAAHFRVKERDILTWVRDHDEFATNIEAARVEADAKVARSLYKNAIGYDVEVDKVVKTRVKGENVVRTVTVVEHVPGNVNAQKFWLESRRPKEWKTPDVIAPATDEMSELLDKIMDTSRGLPNAHPTAKEYGKAYLKKH